jgi:hypothetical protein
MNANLLRSCAGLWFLGLLGMCVARIGLDLDPHTLPFRCAGALWILGFLALVVHDAHAARRGDGGGSASIEKR